MSSSSVGRDDPTEPRQLPCWTALWWRVWSRSVRSLDFCSSADVNASVAVFTHVALSAMVRTINQVYTGEYVLYSFFEYDELLDDESEAVVARLPRHGSVR